MSGLYYEPLRIFLPRSLCFVGREILSEIFYAILPNSMRTILIWRGVKVRTNVMLVRAPRKCLVRAKIVI